ncbi:6-carboxytetrahydropterin synthase QueD [bacterium]|nr:6-carboxytetrahydropterin synthase QueD [bacterium]
MYLLELVETFSAAHALRNYPGICARIHGHNWKIKVVLRCETTDENGMTVDYAVLKKILMNLIAEFDHNLFNDHLYFKNVNPTSEKICEYFYNELEKKFPSAVKMHFVQIWETESFSVSYRP